jgi:hypothetical protein
VRKHFLSKGKVLPIWFYRTAGGVEVDLLIEKGGRFVAVEAKHTETPGPGDLKGFNALQRTYGTDSLILGLLACRTPRHYPLSQTVSAVPGSRISQFIS